MPAAFAEELLHEAMGRLAAKRPVFYNEADFQHSLAWEIQLLRPDAQIRLEVPLIEAEASLHSKRLDLLVIVEGLRLAIELKLPRDTFSFTRPDEPVAYRRRSRDAADDTVYAIVNDIARTERWVEIGGADVNVVLALTRIPEQRIGTWFGWRLGGAVRGQANSKRRWRPFHHGISVLGRLAVRMTGL